MARMFFYGSLRDAEMVGIVLGRRLSAGSLVPARATGHATRRLTGEAYPLLIPEPGVTAQGVVLTDAGPEDMRRLAFFEEAEYGLAPIIVETAQGPLATQYFRATDKTPPTTLPWDYDHWVTHDRAVALEAARELMEVYGTLPVGEIDTVWGAIMARAVQRARAAATPPTPAGIGRRYDARDVTLEGRRVLHRGFGLLEARRLRHRRFDGAMSAPVHRTVLSAGDAVTVLPYDPARDRVLLIEQFRPGPQARGATSPWCLEVIAGRIDADGDPEANARREAEEEAGLTLGRMRRIAAYYSSPGLLSEHMTAFVAEADLPGEGRVHGLASEGEDIRTIVVPRGEAMAAVARAEIDTGPALVSLLWLETNLAALRSDWETRPPGA